MAIISMASEADRFRLEREAEYRALATIGGTSFLDCLRNNGYATEYVLTDAQGNPLKDKKGKEVKIPGQSIGNKKRLDKCLEDHQVTGILCNLTGLGEELIRWYPRWLYANDERCRLLDEAGSRWIYDITPLAVHRYIMWNKYRAYTSAERLRTFVDEDVRDAMALIVHKNEIQSESSRTAISVVNRRIITFIEKYLPRLTDEDLRLQMQEELDELRSTLQSEIPDAFHRHLEAWPNRDLFPRLSETLSLLAPESEPVHA